MALLDSPAATTALDDAVRTRLQGSANPLKLAEVAKGLPKAKKAKAADFQAEVRTILDQFVRQGLAFCYPSAKGGAERYWSRDEKNALRLAAMDLAGTPQTLSGLKTKLGKQTKGTDSVFVEA